MTFQQTQHLLIPGPTPLPDAVRLVMAEPAMGHRSPEFKAILARVFSGLRWAFQVSSPQYDVLLYTASGTGAMEAALCNTLNVGDAVLVLVCGVFSQRWAEIAQTLGLQVDVVSVPAGQANTVEQLKHALSQKTYQAVLMTHSETSTGVLNPIEQFLPLVHQHGALSVVDAVTSLLACDVPVERWQADLVVSGSQKGFMVPPGLAFLSVGPRAWAAHAQCQHPGYYFNFSRNKKAQEGDTTAYTPATSIIRALDVALTMAQAEGLEAIWARHRANQQLIRQGVQALGLELFVPETSQASLAVTAVCPPAGMTVDALRKALKTRFGLIVADGQKELKGQIFRIGHLGAVGERDMAMVLSALKTLLA